MTSAPPPPPGWTLNEDIPQSQQQAQDTVLTYLRRTLSRLPAGTVVDRDGYPGSGGTQWCEDEPEDPNTVPIHVVFTGDLQVPDGMDPAETISAVGETWRGWGWHVFERDGFRKPNQFGYGPDGYRLQIQMPNPATYPPTLIAISPCFPGELAQRDLEVPRVVTQP